MLSTNSYPHYWPWSLNTTKPPFSDLRVRQAMSLAIDRKEMVDTVVFGSGVVSGPIPPGMGSFAIRPDYRLDLDRAKALLREAGVAPAAIDNPRLCTACHPELLYSYRKGNRGRLVTLAALP